MGWGLVWVSKLLLAGTEGCVAQLLCGEESKIGQRSWDLRTLIPTKYFKRSSTIAGVESRELKESRDGGRLGAVNGPPSPSSLACDAWWVGFIGVQGGQQHLGVKFGVKAKGGRQGNDGIMLLHL